MKKSVAGYIMNILVKNSEKSAAKRKGLIGAQKLPKVLKKGK
ncbi:hypothetical protein ACE3MZ_12970 [Paenibacillus sp. WLX1005]